MRESTTYQAILEEGREEGRAAGAAQEARRLLLNLGRIRLGEPEPEILARINAADNLPELETWAARVLEANNWKDVVPDSANGHQCALAQ